MKPFADLVMETTATTGTGDVTTAAVAGWARIEDRYTTGEKFRYCIRNGDNAEVGIGTKKGGSVFERTTVLGTLVAGVATWTGASAITLVGTSVVRVVLDEGYLAELIRESVRLITGNTTLEDGGAYGVQATGLTLTLPASPAQNDRVRIFQAGATATGTIVDPDGNKICGVVGTMAVDVVGFSFSMRYIDAAYGWTVEP